MKLPFIFHQIPFNGHNYAHEIPPIAMKFIYDPQVDRLVGEVQRIALQPFPAELFLAPAIFNGGFLGTV
jgi:hypothetical protein